MDTLVISCIFGKTFQNVYSAPSEARQCYFFCNNPAMESKVTEHGWTFVLVSFPLVDDELTSSLQSKYIKFLAFVPDFCESIPLLTVVHRIIYFDHKFHVDKEWLERIVRVMDTHPSFPIIIRNTPREKTTLLEEVEDARHQARYLKNLDTTLAYIGDSDELNRKTKICNTGLIMYQGLGTWGVVPTNFLKDVYDLCLQHNQPECQIYWALLSLRRGGKDFIQQIAFSEINPTWWCP